MSNFDQIINRKHTDCIKWDSLISKYGENDIIPMGIADMDFLAFDEIQKAILQRAEHGVYGYSLNTKEELSDSIYQRYQKRGYPISKEDIVIGTGVVYEIDHVIKTFTKENDKIVLPSPYYTPFYNLIVGNGRQVLECPMVIRNGHYELDLAKIEELVDEQTTMFIFCNPHNPTGRVYTHEEMAEVADFCQRHQLLIIDDEIHADFSFRHPYETIISVSDYAHQHTFTMLSCTKTFNLAGLKVAFGFICNEQLRQRYLDTSANSGLDAVNIFGIEGLMAAYRYGEQWETDLIQYLANNIHFACQYIKENIPKVDVIEPEGTYLLWLDFSKCHIDNITDFLIEKAHVQLNDGAHYGNFADFARMNCALPLSQLKEALSRIKNALE